MLESQRGQNVSIIFDVLGRLKPGVTLEQAHAELTSLQARLLNFLPWHPRITIGMLPLRERLVVTRPDDEVQSVSCERL